MNLIRKGHGHTHRGVIGVESAIVMIAFVIVAAALAFVVLNMGFSTTQKAKTTIISGLSEASSSLEVSGKVFALTSASVESTPKVNATAIPIKIASGGDPVNLEEGKTTVSYLSNTIEYTDIYNGVMTSGVKTNLRAALARAETDGLIIDDPWTKSGAATEAFVYFMESNEATPNKILDEGEHAVLAISFQDDDGAGTTDERPAALDRIRIELTSSTGATLTVERDIPTLSYDIEDLG